MGTLKWMFIFKAHYEVLSPPSSLYSTTWWKNSS